MAERGECKFEGTAEYATIRAIKSAVSIPVFANGDICSAAKAHAVLEESGADGIMIGRGALGQGHGCFAISMRR